MRAISTIETESFFYSFDLIFAIGSRRDLSYQNYSREQKENDLKQLRKEKARLRLPYPVRNIYHLDYDVFKPIKDYYKPRSFFLQKCETH